MDSSTVSDFSFLCGDFEKIFRRIEIFINLGPCD